MSVIRTKLRLKRPRTFNSDEAPLKKTADNSLTKAEISFQKHHEKIFEKKIENNIKITHKDRVEKFNKRLTDLAEHYDIPRVGPG